MTRLPECVVAAGGGHDIYKLTRNGSVSINFSEMTMAPSKSSISGFTMLEGKPLNIPDVYAIPKTAAFRHDSEKFSAM